MTPLTDGAHPAIVIDCEPGVGDDGTRLTHLELALLTGERKGDVVAVTAREDLGDFIELLGMPATVTVTDGQPSVTIDR